MNETNLTEHLLLEYVRIIEPSPKLQGGLEAMKSVRRRRFGRWPLRLSAVAALAAVLLFFQFGRSGSALARTIGRIRFAMTDARTMVIESYLVRPSHTPFLGSRSELADGMYLRDSFAPIRHIKVILRDGKQFYYWIENRAITEEPFKDKGEFPGSSGLDIGKEFLDQGDTELPLREEVVAHAPEDGHETYAIVADRDGSHGILVVDKETNLPIYAETQVEDTGPSIKSREVFHFNQPIPVSDFDPSFGTKLPILDLPSEWSRLRKQWDKPLATATIGGQTLHIRDLRVNDRGEVFMVISQNLSDDGATEGSLVPQSITDDEGTVYITGASCVVGGVEGDTDVREAMRFGEETTRILCWIPIARPTQRPSRFTVECSIGNSLGNNSVPEIKAFHPTAGSVQVDVNVGGGGFDGEFPDYCTPLVMDTITNQWEYQLPWEVGDYLDRLGRTSEALGWYQRAYAIWRVNWPSQSYHALDSMAKSYGELGKSGLAAEASRLSREIQDGLRPAPKFDGGP